MKENEIVEGNKLIARSPFADDEIREWINDIKNPSNRFCTKTLKYHTSWDWLMPAISKFEQVTDCQFDWENTAYENDVLSINKAWQTLTKAIEQYKITQL